MLIAAVSRLVELCTRFPWVVITFVLATAIVSGAYSASHFAITTDINKLISRDLPWRQHEAAFEQPISRPFPVHAGGRRCAHAGAGERGGRGAVRAAARRASSCSSSVEDLSGNPFFARNGLLFQPAAEVKQFTHGLAQASALIDVLASDQSLRGLTCRTQSRARRRAAGQIRRSTRCSGR